MDEPVKEQQVDEVIDLQELLSRILAKRWWILACVLASTAGFSAVAFLSRPIYRATTVLVAADLDSDNSVLNFTSSALGGLTSDLGIGPHDTRTEEALAVLRSREFTESFIADKKLMPELFPRKWNPQTGTWKVGLWSEPTLARAYKYFDRNIRTITEDRRTGLITLQIDWTNRNEAAAWANELISRLNDEMRARAMTQADASLQFLTNEIQSATTIEGREAIGRLMENQVKQRMLAHVTQDYSLRVVDKAIAWDKADPIRPQKPLLLTLGPLLGLGVGVVLASVFGTAPSKKRIAAS